MGSRLSVIATAFASATPWAGCLKARRFSTWDMKSASTTRRVSTKTLEKSPELLQASAAACETEHLLVRAVIEKTLRGVLSHHGNSSPCIGRNPGNGSYRPGTNEDAAPRLDSVVTIHQCSRQSTLRSGSRAYCSGAP